MMRRRPLLDALAASGRHRPHPSRAQVSVDVVAFLASYLYRAAISIRLPCTLHALLPGAAHSAVHLLCRSYATLTLAVHFTAFRAACNDAKAMSRTCRCIRPLPGPKLVHRSFYTEYSVLRRRAVAPTERHLSSDPEPCASNQKPNHMRRLTLTFPRRGCVLPPGCVSLGGIETRPAPTVADAPCHLVSPDPGMPRQPSHVEQTRRS